MPERATPQAFLLPPAPAVGCGLTFDLTGEGNSARRALEGLDPVGMIGIGTPFGAVPGLRSFPAIPGKAPSTQRSLWAFVGGATQGDVLDRARSLRAALEGCFTVTEEVWTFCHRGEGVITGYEDGTENPEAAAAEIALVSAQGEGRDGGSFVAVQTWVHDLSRFAAVSLAWPDATMLRRSMPFGDTSRQGLYFVAYGNTLDRFERVLRRMSGLDDGVVDALFDFSRAVTGGYYWCPPLRKGRLDLRELS